MAIMLNSRSNVYENIFFSVSQPPDSSTILQPAGIAVRVAALIELLRSTAGYFDSEPVSCFQVLVNTHSPAVMAALQDEEVVVADLISTVRRGGQRTVRTRMRAGVFADSETGLTRVEVDNILRRPAEAV